MNSHIKIQVVLVRQSGRTPRALFPLAESAIFGSEAAKKDLARKPNLKNAFLSKKRTILKICGSRALFASILKSKGSKTPKTVEKCKVLRLRPVNSNMKLQFLLMRQSGQTPWTLFPPPGSAILGSGMAKKELTENTQEYVSGKRPLRATSTKVWKVLPATSRSKGLKNRWR